MLIQTLSVPYISQSNNFSCGAAVLAMIYAFYGISRKENEIWEENKKPRNLQSGFYITTKDLIYDAKNFGLKETHGIMPLNDLELVKTNIIKIIKSKLPIIACKQFSDDCRLGHFVVIIGINDSNIIYHDPYNDGKKRKLKLKKFIKEWLPANEEVTGGVFLLFYPRNKSYSLEETSLLGIKKFDL